VLDNSLILMFGLVVLGGCQGRPETAWAKVDSVIYLSSDSSRYAVHSFDLEPLDNYHEQHYMSFARIPDSIATPVEGDSILIRIVPDETLRTEIIGGAR